MLIPVPRSSLTVLLNSPSVHCYEPFFFMGDAGGVPAYTLSTINLLHELVQLGQVREDG